MYDTVYHRSLMSLSFLQSLLVSVIVIVLYSSMLPPLHWLCPAVSHWQSPTLFPVLRCCGNHRLIVACHLLFVVCLLSLVLSCHLFVVYCLSFIVCHLSFILCCLPCQVIAWCFYADPPPHYYHLYGSQPGYRIFLVELWIEGTCFVCSPRTARSTPGTTWGWNTNDVRSQIRHRIGPPTVGPRYHRGKNLKKYHHGRILWVLY